jgi:hypothetical protein
MSGSQNRNVEGGGDDLLAAVIQRTADVDASSGWNLLSFAVRCLEFMIPSPKLSKLIAQTFMERYFAWGKLLDYKMHASELMAKGDILPVEIMGSLLSCAAENRPAVAVTIEKFLSTEVRQATDEVRTCMALEITANLVTPLYRQRHRFPAALPESADYWNELSTRLMKEFSPRRGLLAPKYFQVCVEGVLADETPLTKLVEWHGPESLFRECECHMLAMTRVSMVELCMWYVFEESKENRKEGEPDRSLSMLHEVGRLLLHAKKPIISSGRLGRVGFPSHIFNLSRNLSSRLDSSALFGMLCGCAVFLELSVGRSRNPPTLEQEVKMVPIPLIRDLLLARLQGIFGAELEKAIAKAGFRLRRNGYGATRVKGEKKTLKAEDASSVAPQSGALTGRNGGYLAVDSVFPDLSGHP